MATRSVILDPMAVGLMTTPPYFTEPFRLWQPSGSSDATIDPCEVFLNLDELGYDTAAIPESQDSIESSQSAGSPRSVAWSTHELPSPPTSGSSPASRQASPVAHQSTENITNTRVSKPGNRKKKVVVSSQHDIESRYRKKLKYLIADLAAEIPTLMYTQSPNTTDPDKQRWSQGLVPTGKRTRATIYDKTIEYIRHLEERCRLSELGIP